MMYPHSIDESARVIDDRRGSSADESIGNLSTERWNLSMGGASAGAAVNAALIECAVLNPPIVSTALRGSRPGCEAAFREAYVAEYQTRLPDKELLRANLHKFYALTETDTE